jgi:hypothetical protein
VHRRVGVVIRDTGPWAPAVDAGWRRRARGDAAGPAPGHQILPPAARRRVVPLARARPGWAAKVIGHCDVAPWNIVTSPDLTSHPIALWAMAWRARSAAWMLRHRRTLEAALTRGSP